MNIKLRNMLERLESRIKPEHEIALRRSWIDFWEGRCAEVIHAPCRSVPNPSPISEVSDIFEALSININDAVTDYELMALNQYAQALVQLEFGSGAILNVRCNYGSSLIPSLFGVKMFHMPRETNTLPTSIPFNDIDQIKMLLDAGVPDLNNGLGGNVLEMGEIYMQTAARFPKISEFVYVYHPDLQGPLDICEVIWGSRLLLDFYENPDLVRDFLNLCTQTYIAFMKKWQTIVPPRKTYNSHWGLLHKGVIFLRDDSSVNISPDMFREFVLPLNQLLLDTLGNGAIHFCGKGDHLVSSLCSLRGLCGINISQPHLNDMDKILNIISVSKVKLVGMDYKAAQVFTKNYTPSGTINCMDAKRLEAESYIAKARQNGAKN